LLSRRRVAKLLQNEPVRENRLRVTTFTLPDGLASHSSVQKFYFGEDFLLRRQDYTLDIAGGRSVAHYVFNCARFDGLVVPTKRRAYLCDDGYRVLHDRLLIALDLSEIEYR